MAYKPTLYDIEEVHRQEGYNPSLEDVTPSKSFFDTGLGKTTAFVGDVGSQLINKNAIDPANMIIRALQNGPIPSKFSQEKPYQIPQIPQMMPDSTLANVADWTATGLDLGAGVYGLAKLGLKGVQALKGLGSQKIAENIVRRFTQGKSPEENAKELANRIYNSRETQANRVGQRFNNLIAHHGEEPIQVPEYSQSPIGLVTKRDYKLRDTHNKFIKNPTFENAHWLQSHLGEAVQEFKNKGKINTADKQRMYAAQDAQNALHNDITNHFMNTNAPESAYEYKAARDDYRRNVVPYGEGKNLSLISRGEKTNPSSNVLSKIFERPEDTEGKTTIISHIPEATNNIISTHLGKLQGAETPQDVLSTLHDIFKNRGFQYYKTPEHEILSAQLANAMQREKNIKKWLPKRLLGYDVLPERTREQTIVKNLKKSKKELKEMK